MVHLWSRQFRQLWKKISNECVICNSFSRQKQRSRNADSKNNELTGNTYYHTWARNNSNWAEQYALWKRNWPQTTNDSMFSLKVLIRLSVQYMCVSEGFFPASSWNVTVLYYFIIHIFSSQRPRTRAKNRQRNSDEEQKRLVLYMRNDENPTATANSKWRRNENHSMHCEALVIQKLISIGCVWNVNMNTNGNTWMEWMNPSQISQIP